MMNKKTKSEAAKANNFFKNENYIDAEKAYKKLLAQNSTNESIQYNYAYCLFENGKITAAISILTHQATYKPNSKNLTLLGKALRTIRDFERAEKVLHKAIECDEKNHEAWCELSIVYCFQAQYERSILLLERAIELKDKNTQCYDIILPLCFANYEPKTFNIKIKEILNHGLQEKNVTTSHYAKCWHRLIRIDPSLFQSLKPLIKQNYNVFEKTVKKMTDSHFFTDDLFINGIEKIRISEPYLENFLKNLRRFFLHSIEKNHFSEEHLKLLKALSHQCFLNEYVFSSGSEEKEILEKIFHEIKTQQLKTQDLENKIIILSCYKELYAYKDLIELFKSKKLNRLKDIIQLQLKDREKEEALKQTIQTIGTLNDETTQEVRQQYEENPYPRWSDYANPKDNKLKVGRISFSNFECRETLIAGCGTGQQIATQQFNFPNSHITAVDISLSSIAFAKRKAQEFKYKNVDFYHADILELAQLNKSFDFIACTGVLHHMKDPLKGFKALTNVLKPGGYMFIGLYSETARKNVIAARQFIEENNYYPTPDGIRQCREHILSLPDTHPVKRITQSSDFYTLSTCRDLIFHVQEHRYTIPLIQETIDECGLKFIEMNAHTAEDLKNYKNMFPHEKSMNTLENIEIFEEKYTAAFARMYQFWLYKPS